MLVPAEKIYKIWQPTGAGIRWISAAAGGVYKFLAPTIILFFSSTHPNTEHLFKKMLDAYKNSVGKQVSKWMEFVRLFFYCHFY